MNEVTIPNLSLGEYGYEGQITLNSWRNFNHKLSYYEFVDVNKKTDWTCNISIGGDMIDDNPKIQPEHVAAYNYLIENQVLIRENILHSLDGIYPDLQKSYGYSGNEKKKYMPNVKDTEGFKKLIGLSRIHIMNVFKDGVAFVGYEFGCLWDEEHGMGVMTYKDKVFEVNGADISFMTWIAEKYLKTL